MATCRNAMRTHIIRISSSCKLAKIKEYVDCTVIEVGVVYLQTKNEVTSSKRYIQSNMVR